MTFDRAPFIVIWETTRACALAWALFFLVPVGRAQAHDAVDAHEIEHVLGWAATDSPFAEDPGCVWQPQVAPAVGAVR